MSLSSTLTKHVVSETLIRVVSLLSSASRDMSAEQVKALVLAKIEQNPVQFAECNDIGLCVSRLEMICSFSNIMTDEELAANYDTIRNDEIVTDTISSLAAGIARNIAPVIFELREVLPRETHALTTKINDQIPAIESAFNQDSALRVFNWGKLNNPMVLSSAMTIASDKVNCFKGGHARQHDSSNILRHLPLNRVEGLSLSSDTKQSLKNALTAAAGEENSGVVAAYVDQALNLITNDKVYLQTIGSMREALSGTIGLSASIVSVTEKIDGMEDVLRLLSADVVADTDISTSIAAKLFSNVETALTNIVLLRASMIFHKIHTLQGKLILADNTVQESTLATFREAGGTDQMIKNHLLYMEINTTQNIPNNGLSLDVVLNSSAKAQSTVQKHAESIKETFAAKQARALQDAVSRGLTTHYMTAVESGTYHPRLEQIHSSQLGRAIASLRRRSVDDIALEYLVTLRDNTFVTGFYKAINEELVGIVKGNDQITNAMVSEAVCGGVVSVVYNTIVEKFSAPQRKRA